MSTSGERRTPSLATYRDDEFRYHSDSARDGILHIRSLSDRLLIEGMTEGSPSHQDIVSFVGPDTNPSWVTAQCAEQAYDRGLIDEQELDWATR